MSSTGNSSSSSSAASGGAGSGGGGAAAEPILLPDDPSRATPSTLLAIYRAGAERVHRAVELIADPAAREATFERLFNIAVILQAATDPAFEPATAEQLAAASLGAGARGAASAASSAGKRGRAALASAAGSAASLGGSALGGLASATGSAASLGGSALGGVASLGGSAAIALSAKVRAAIQIATSKETVEGLRGIYQTIAEIAVSGGRLSYDKMGEILALIIRTFSSLRTGIYEGIVWAKTMGQLTYGFLKRRLSSKIDTYTKYFNRRGKFPAVTSLSRRGARIQGYSDTPAWLLAKEHLREQSKVFIRALAASMKRSRVESKSYGSTAGTSFLDRVMLAISSEEYGAVTAEKAIIIILLKAYITLLTPARERRFAELEADDALTEEGETFYQSTTNFFRNMIVKLLQCGRKTAQEEVGGYSSTASMNVVSSTQTPIIPLTPEEYMTTLYAAFDHFIANNPGSPVTAMLLSIVNLTPISDTLRPGVTIEQVKSALLSVGVDIMSPPPVRHGSGGGARAAAVTCTPEGNEEEEEEGGKSAASSSSSAAGGSGASASSSGGGGGASASSSGSVFSGVDYNPYGSFTSSAPSAPPALAFARNDAMNAFEASRNEEEAPPAAKRAPVPVPEDPSQEGGARRTRSKNRKSQKKVRKVKKQVRKTRHHKKRVTRRR